MDGEYQVATDKKEKIKLDSEIVSAEWLSDGAHGGQEAAFKIVTYAVAEGSPIEIKGYSSSGKAPGTLKGKVFNNQFTGGLLIPEKAELGAEIGFEAKLPKHGLKKECPTTIPACPVIQVSSMAWSKKQIHRGELVKLTAQFVNPLPDTEAVILIFEYDPDGHHELYCSFSSIIKKDSIAVDWEFRYTGDTAQIPTEAELQKFKKHYVPPEYFFVIEINGVRIGEGQESQMLRFMDTVVIKPRKGRVHDDSQEYVITLADGKEIKQKVDKDGTIIIENCAPGKFDIWPVLQ